MPNKFILIVIFLVLTFLVQPVYAEEKKDVKEKKTTAKSAKCWKRMPPLEKALMSPEYGTVCKAFEEVLNTTCEPPEKLMCNWTLPKGEKRFKKLEWQPLDPKEYWGLIEDMVLSGWNEKYRAGKWEKLEPEYKQDLLEGRLKLSVTTVDIDQDGKPEQVVLFNTRSCAETGWKDLIDVMKPDTKRVDWRYRWVGRVNADQGAEIMLYNDKAYMFGMDTYATQGIVMVYKGFSLFEGTEFGSRGICRFYYMKGRQ